MALPTQYKFLDTLGPLPKALAIALQYQGIREIPGLKSNPLILQMAETIGVSKIYKNDDTEWCALLVNNCLKLAGKPLPDHKGDLWNYLRALYCLNFGIPVAAGDERVGDVMVFKRKKGGHVGFYIAESPKTFHIFGGNQANSAGFTEMERGRYVGARRLYQIGMPASAIKAYVDASGIVSTNEA